MNAQDIVQGEWGTDNGHSFQVIGKNKSKIEIRYEEDEYETDHPASRFFRNDDDELELKQ